MDTKRDVDGKGSRFQRFYKLLEAKRTPGLLVYPRCPQIVFELSLCRRE